MKVITKPFLNVCRTLHVYLTMAGLLVLLLFGVTGFTINHEDWFGATTPRVTETEGRTPLSLVTKKDALRIVEHLRATFRISGAMTDYDDASDRVMIAFKEPGRTWEVQIEKVTGATKIHEEAFNFAAIINDLHRGRYAGQIWRWVIDVSALLIVIACTTGMVLWIVLPRRRIVGIIALLLGVVGTLGIIYLFVPGKDAPTRQMSPAQK